MTDSSSSFAINFSQNTSLRLFLRISLSVVIVGMLAACTLQTKDFFLQLSLKPADTIDTVTQPNLINPDVENALKNLPDEVKQRDTKSFVVQGQSNAQFAVVTYELPFEELTPVFEIDMGEEVIAQTIPDRDVYVTTMNPEGELEWVELFGLAVHSEEEGYAVTWYYLPGGIDIFDMNVELDYPVLSYQVPFAEDVEFWFPVVSPDDIPSWSSDSPGELLNTSECLEETLEILTAPLPERKPVTDDLQFSPDGRISWTDRGLGNDITVKPEKSAELYEGLLRGLYQFNEAAGNKDFLRQFPTYESLLAHIKAGKGPIKLYIPANNTDVRRTNQARVEEVTVDLSTIGIGFEIPASEDIPPSLNDSFFAEDEYIEYENERGQFKVSITKVGDKDICEFRFRRLFLGEDPYGYNRIPLFREQTILNRMKAFNQLTKSVIRMLGRIGDGDSNDAHGYLCIYLSRGNDGKSRSLYDNFADLEKGFFIPR